MREVSLAVVLGFQCVVLSTACGSNGSSSGAPGASAGAPSAGTSPALGGGGGSGPILSVGGSMIATMGGTSAGGTPSTEKACDSSCASVGTCVEGTCRVQDNVGNVTPDQQTSLRNGGSGAPEAFAWLYPYDQTVFPRGLVPPTMQFDGGAMDAAYVHISFPGFDYAGFFGPSDPARIKLPNGVWTALTSSAHAADSVKVEVTKLRDGMVTGPIARSWTIAPGSMRGTIYYDAWDMSGTVMRLRPGEESSQTLFPGGTCTAVSGDGSTLIALFGDGFHSYDLRADAQLITETHDGNPNRGSLTAMGDLAMFFLGPAASALRDTKTGAPFPTTGWTASAGGGAFAPDGRRIAFSSMDGTINLMDFALATKTFSNARQLGAAGDSVGNVAFTPDSGSVIYAAPDGSNGRGRLSRVDVETGQMSVLANAYHRDNNSDGTDGWVTTLPIAVGGYFWIAFSSVRSYGNGEQSSANNQVWVAAVDLAATAADSSHPAFYLDGQEPDSINRFASWALDPCKGDGGTCSSGDQCCGGYCRELDGAPQCLSTPPADAKCAAEYEKCAKADDCCDKRFACINDFCAVKVK